MMGKCIEWRHTLCVEYVYSLVIGFTIDSIDLTLVLPFSDGINSFGDILAIHMI
jgi:hypothetical protein